MLTATHKFLLKKQKKFSYIYTLPKCNLVLNLSETFSSPINADFLLFQKNFAYPVVLKGLQVNVRHPGKWCWSREGSFVSQQLIKVAWAWPARTGRWAQQALLRGKLSPRFKSSADHFLLPASSLIRFQRVYLETKLMLSDFSSHFSALLCIRAVKKSQLDFLWAVITQATFHPFFPLFIYSAKLLSPCCVPDSVLSPGRAAMSNTHWPPASTAAMQDTPVVKPKTARWRPTCSRPTLSLMSWLT